MFQHQLLSTSTKQLIAIFITTYIIPDAICRFIYEYSNISLIPKQIKDIVGNIANHVEVSQKIELIDYMNLTKGHSYVYHRNEKKFSNIHNMKYAEVVYTDGTSFANKFGWKFHPITGQDGNLNTILFGVLFTGLFDSEIAKWFLHTIFFKTPLGEIAETLITNEDTCIMSIFEDLS